MIEQLYSDFITNIAPKIQEGLVITKDFFIDLFGRYVKYLIITDSIKLAVSLLIFISCIVVMVVFIPKTIKVKDYGEIHPANMLWILMFVPVLISFIGIASDMGNLIKDLYIPEIRIVEILKSQNNNN